MAREMLTFSGFNDLIDKIKKAEGNTSEATASAVKAGAGEYKNQLISACKSAGVPNDLINDIKTEIKQGDNYCSCRVGWQVPTYNPSNPANAFKVIFLNYGTPKRTTKSGANRGAVKEHGFIAKAKRAARPKIKKAQQKALERILKDLKQ